MDSCFVGLAATKIQWAWSASCEQHYLPAARHTWPALTLWVVTGIRVTRRYHDNRSMSI
ncbi:hypothetical protein M419DRAFT_119714 [Trichoderma reesei RUT C-30]|uniref:Uncharacterized protein n=1 Tax=Hypocrea jecorina (strain ATCC 56765 / BCRC 32924 / NRRL 11460 / Rut C-30) TaxID=1344414 RepID=A0A024S520_HYPJR|nr:hypothetical protein M419DRAFT_119714 [Trichoderma reesei RUT C-30]